MSQNITFFFDFFLNCLEIYKPFLTYKPRKNRQWAVWPMGHSLLTPTLVHYVDFMTCSLQNTLLSISQSDLEGILIRRDTNSC